MLLPSGARGDTRRAIERAVCVPHDFHCVHFQMKRLREKLAGSLKMASQVFHNPGITVAACISLNSKNQSHGQMQRFCIHKEQKGSESL